MSTTQQENRELTEARSRYREMEQRHSAAQASNAGLQARVHELESAAAASDQQRAAVLAEIDRFRAVFESRLTSYRAQRAWQVMLLCRKAYTLFFRKSKADFLRWLLRIPVYGFGSLAGVLGGTAEDVIVASQALGFDWLGCGGG